MVKIKKILVFKKIVFLTLFVLFYIYYLKPIIAAWKTNQNRKKQLTNTAKDIEKVKLLSLDSNHFPNFVSGFSGSALNRPILYQLRDHSSIT